MMAALLLVAVLYGFLRVRPVRSQRALLSKNIQEAEARLAAMPSPEEPLGDPGKMEGELREIKREMAQKQAQLDLLEKGFVALENPTALYRLQAEMSVWAKKCGLHILEETDDTAKGGAQLFGVTHAATPTDARPRRHLRAETSYDGFLKFLRGFSERSGSVTLREYTLEPAKISENEVPEDRLEVTMTLAF
jgi:hypothetical protein